MALTTEQKDFISLLHIQGIQIIQQGSQEALLMSLATKMEAIKAIIDASTEEELNYYCQKYDGFFQYMKLLEELARGCSEGLFDDIYTSK